MAFVAVSAVTSCGGKDKAAATDSTAATASNAAGSCAGDNAGLTLPSGFCATIFADSVHDGRHVAVAPNGDVYITIEGTKPSPEKALAGQKAPDPRAAVIALRDTNRDGHADLVARIGTLGNTGVAVSGGYLYVDEGTRVVRYARADTQLAPTGAPETIVDGIPLEPGHRARNFLIGNAGELFLNVGSATNSCQRQDRTLESPGVDPCKELERRAGIWKFDANKPGQHFAPSARFATGIRNGMGIAYGPGGLLYATQHGRDQLHDSWPKTFPSYTYQAENPAEELMQVNAGDDFGWPYCYYSVEEKKLVDAPEYGGDGKRGDRCTGKKGPVAIFPGHWAPMSLTFAGSGTGSFPEHYRSGAFIAFHGSWNRAPEAQAGYRVVFQPMSGGSAGGDFETFADGFTGLPEGQAQPDRAKHRPTGLAFAPDGALFITDDAGGRVYRVTYGSGTPRTGTGTGGSH
jgi:glucose/arabinose dehydrogenase